MVAEVVAALALGHGARKRVAAIPAHEGFEAPRQELGSTSIEERRLRSSPSILQGLAVSGSGAAELPPPGVDRLHRWLPSLPAIGRPNSSYEGSSVVDRGSLVEDAGVDARIGADRGGLSAREEQADQGGRYEQGDTSDRVPSRCLQDARTSTELRPGGLQVKSCAGATVRA